MYGTIAQMRVKAGKESGFAALSRDIEEVAAPGHIASYVYQMDRDSREFFLAVIFESREAYHANAASPEQHQQFLKLMEYLESEPVWNEGEIVYATQREE
jgi:antibiotic biosynthesis monooxygenase (ABM) superfamily enzyme